MALPATDTFTNTNGTALSTHNANWVVGFGSFDIQSNACRAANADAYSLAYWTGDTFDNNQYSQIVAVALVDDNWVGANVRCGQSDNVDNGYQYQASLYNSGYQYAGKEVSEMVDGTVSVLDSIYYSGVSVNDVMRLEVSGTTLTPKLNGSTDTDLGTTTDSSFSSGRAGVSGYHNSTNSRLDTWEGGNLSSTTTVTLNAATLTASAQTITLAPGAVSVSVNAVTLTASPQTITLVPGAVSVIVGAATLTASPQAITLVPGAVTVSVNAATLASSAGTISVSSATLVLLNAATLVSSAEAITLVPGEVTVTINAATLTAEAQGIVPLYTLLPVADTSLGSWTDDDGGTTDIYTTIDESVIDDADYIMSPNLPAANTYKAELEDASDPGVHTNHIVLFRCRKTGDSDISLRVRLMEGEVTIASWEKSLSSDWVTYEEAVADSDAATISSYSDLFLEFEGV